MTTAYRGHWLGAMLAGMLGPAGATTHPPAPPQPVEIALPDLVLGADFYPAPGDARRPAVLLLHGWHWPDERPTATMAPYAREFQAAGYHVLVPGLRGWQPSGGRDDCAGRQVDDTLAALAWLARQPRVIGDRLYLSGYSQGGHVALLASARGAPVAATAVFAPVTHPASWGRQTDVDGIRDYLVDACGGPRGWRARDVIARADAIIQPVLLVHGLADTRVPPAQSQRLYTRLRTLERPVALRLLADSGHAIGEVLRPQLAVEFFAGQTTSSSGADAEAHARGATPSG